MDFRKASRGNHAVDYTETFTVHDLEITLRYYISFRSSPLPCAARPLHGCHQAHAATTIAVTGINSDEATHKLWGGLSGCAGRRGPLKKTNDLYVGLLNSRPVVDAIIGRFNLAQIYRAKDMTAGREKLAKYIAITSLKEGFVVVAVSDKDKKRAAQ
jgi:hypothetical protein